jgi:hypothetical protein
MFIKSSWSLKRTNFWYLSKWAGLKRSIFQILQKWAGFSRRQIFYLRKIKKILELVKVGGA